jgi:sugar/nucleoside kinase (ribokinase family)
VHVVCVGLATVDLVQRVARMPGTDEKVEALSAEVAAGGPATNAAVTAAALGAEVTLVTAVGAHALGGLIRADLDACGVTLLDATPGTGSPPPVSAVTVLDLTGQRTIVSRNARDVAVAVPPEFARVLATADAVLVDGHHPALARAAARGGRRLVVDAGSWRPVFADVLPRADVVACSAAFRLPEAADPKAAPQAAQAADPTTALQAAQAADPTTALQAAQAADPTTALQAAQAADPTTALQAAQAADPEATLRAAGAKDTEAALRAAGVRRGAITHGPEPVRWWSGDAAGELAVPPVAAVDTAGAGDAFHGALTVALAGDPDLLAALRYAITVAGVRVTRAGPRGWLGDPALSALRV